MRGETAAELTHPSAPQEAAEVNGGAEEVQSARPSAERGSRDGGKRSHSNKSSISWRIRLPGPPLPPLPQRSCCSQRPSASD